MLPWKLRAILIKRIGKIYDSVSPELKFQLMKDESKNFKQEMISRYGSWKNYLFDLSKRNGCKSYAEYQKMLVNRRGYASIYEYRKALAKEKGFNTLWEMTWAVTSKENGFKRPTDMILQRVKRRGFNSVAEYEDWLAQKRGFVDRAEFRRVKHNNEIIVNQELKCVATELKETKK